MDTGSRLMAKFIADGLTPDELAQMMEWRKQSAENEALFSQALRLRINERFISYNTPERIERAFEKSRKGTNRHKLYGLVKYAALLVMLIGLSYGGWTRFHKTMPGLTISVKGGEGIKRVDLDDGTAVWLNKGAWLRIPDSFSAENRKIAMEGEGYFEVAKNPDSPFLVETRHINIKVFGTSFSINTNAKANAVETILATGKVAILDKKGKTIVNMSPGEKVTFIPKRNEYEVETIDANISTSWHLDQLKFENATLREIVNKLSAIYDVNINLESKILADRRFRCVINRDEKLTEVLEILKYLAMFKYRIEGDEIFIYEHEN